MHAPPLGNPGTVISDIKKMECRPREYATDLNGLGNWPYQFGDVQNAIGPQRRRIQVAPKGFGSTVACAIVDHERLHICAIAKDGRLYHTFRENDGSWPYAFGDVLSAVGPTITPQLDPPLSAIPTPLSDVSCCAGKDAYLHVCVVDYHGDSDIRFGYANRLWHTIRYPSGEWQNFFNDVLIRVGLSDRSNPTKDFVPVMNCSAAWYEPPPEHI